MGRRGPQPTEQTLAIVQLLKRGLTYRSIAEQYGLSTQRVGSIAKQNNLTRREPKE